MELCSIASGSSGNCICVGTDECHVLVDAGISGKRIESGLNSIDLKTEEMQGILITHEHVDHIAGLGVLARRYGLPMYAAVAAGMGFSAAVWAVTALATAAWSPDKLMAFTIPSFIYSLWSADAAEWFLGLSIPHPASLFNDGLSPERLRAALASYGVLFAVSLAAYCAGCERRLRHA